MLIGVPIAILVGCTSTITHNYASPLIIHRHLLTLETPGVRWTGTIPSEIGLLSNSLERLTIDGAQFASQNEDDSTTIPTELYSLTNFRSLTLSNSKLGGTISHFIGQLTALESLDLSGNHFHGVVPSEIGLLTNLRVLNLQNNPYMATEEGVDLPTELRRQTLLVDDPFG